MKLVWRSAVWGVLFLSLPFSSWAAITVTPSNPVVVEGSTVKLSANIPVSWSLAPGSLGSVDSDGTYHAPAQITANNSVLGCQMRPNDDVFNTRIDNLPVSGNSGSWFSQLPTFPLIYEPSWGVNKITNATPSSAMTFLYTLLNSGPFQIPAWPILKQESGDFVSPSADVDRHITSVNTDTCQSSDIYSMHTIGFDLQNPLTNAQSGVKYDGTSYSLPNGASDAAGLELQPLSIHLSEIEAGIIKHAARVTLSNSWITRAFVWPATANAIPYNATFFPYGARFRLKASFDISKFSPIAQVLLTQMKNYGLVVADGGTNFGIQTDLDVSEDSAVTAAMMQIHWSNQLDATLPALDSRAFEMVDETGLQVSPVSGAVTSGTAVIATDTSNPSNAVRTPMALHGVAVGTTDAVINIAGGASIQIKAWATGTTLNGSLSWSMNPVLGTLSSSGLYTAPSAATLSSTMITVASVENPSAKTLIKVNVIPAPAGVMRMKVGGLPGGTYAPVTNGQYGPDSQGNMWWLEPGSQTGGDYALNEAYGTPWKAVPDIWLYYTYDTTYGDWRHDFTVPNGNYTITLMFARGSDPENSMSTTAYDAGATDQFYLETQGAIVNNQFNLVTALGNKAGQPLSVTMPAQVTDGHLYFALRRLLQGAGAANLGPSLNAFTIARTSVTGTGNPCDLTGDGVVNVQDVQTAVNQALGVASCVADLNQDGQCTVIDVQRVSVAAQGGACVSP